jgi:carboxylate-amine ligase
VRFLYATGSIDEHTQLWWSVRPHLAFPTVELRIMDAQPDLGESRSLVAFAYALTARIVRAVDEGEPLPSWPHRLLEENLWRALRHGLSGELLDLARGEPVAARARLEQLVDWVLPVAEELGAASWLAIPERNSAERQIARHEEGASMEEIFAELVRTGEHVGT